MKHLFVFFLCFILPYFSAVAQNLSLVSSSGTYSENSSGSISWSIGEVVIVTSSSGSNDVTQGFHQSRIYFSGIEELKELEISIYPNPTSEFVNIVSPNTVKLSIYDMSGRLVRIHDLSDDINQVDVTDLSRGTYNLVFETKQYPIKTAKLVVQ